MSLLVITILQHHMSKLCLHSETTRMPSAVLVSSTVQAVFACLFLQALLLNYDRIQKVFLIGQDVGELPFAMNVLNNASLKKRSDYMCAWLKVK